MLAKRTLYWAGTMLMLIICGIVQIFQFASSEPQYLSLHVSISQWEDLIKGYLSITLSNQWPLSDWYPAVLTEDTG